MDYLLLKQVHIGFALISIFGFIIRWTWMMNESRLLRLRITRTLPHVIDTLFLISGLLLALTIGQYPFGVDWLTAKVGGLVLYILLGMVSMSARVSKAMRVTAFLAAVSCFAWIVSVARFKSPPGFFGL